MYKMPPWVTFEEPLFSRLSTPGNRPSYAVSLARPHDERVGQALKKFHYRWRPTLLGDGQRGALIAIVGTTECEVATIINGAYPVTWAGAHRTPTEARLAELSRARSMIRTAYGSCTAFVLCLEQGGVRRVLLPEMEGVGDELSFQTQLSHK